MMSSAMTPCTFTPVAGQQMRTGFAIHQGYVARVTRNCSRSNWMNSFRGGCSSSFALSSTRPTSRPVIMRPRSAASPDLGAIAARASAHLKKKGPDERGR